MPSQPVALLQGTLDLIVLQLLSADPTNGFDLAQRIRAISREHLSPRCGSEAVLSIGAGIEWLKDPRFAGVISVMPHGCMPGGIVAAMSEKFTTVYQKPWISLTYDGFAETNNLTRINEFAELVKFCQATAKQA